MDNINKIIEYIRETAQFYRQDLDTTLRGEITFPLVPNMTPTFDSAGISQVLILLGSIAIAISTQTILPLSKNNPLQISGTYIPALAFFIGLSCSLCALLALAGLWRFGPFRIIMKWVIGSSFGLIAPLFILSAVLNFIELFHLEQATNVNVTVALIFEGIVTFFAMFTAYLFI